MIYIVTGTPGTGKTTFAKKYAEENQIIYVDGHKVIEDYKLTETVDAEDGCNVVDEKKFAKVCKDIIKEVNDNNQTVIIDSHLSHYINSKIVDKCFVTECDLQVLKKRLEKRKYSKSKIKDNLEAEAFKSSRGEAEENGHTIEIINNNLE